jgi:hypothetical protein
MFQNILEYSIIYFQLNLKKIKLSQIMDLIHN